MADWSQLPKELLHLIWERLDSTLYGLRFRSVCSSWRSSCSPVPVYHPLPSEFLTLSNDYSNSYNNSDNNPSTLSIYIYKLTFFLITPPQQQQQQQQQQTLQPRLIKIRQDPGGGTNLCHPLVCMPIEYFTSHFPQPLDLYELPVIDLGHQFFLNVMDNFSFRDCYIRKVVFAWLGSGFFLLTILITGKLILLRFGDERWTKIPFINSSMTTRYNDVCVFKGRLFAVDKTGRTVVVGSDSSLVLAAEPVSGGEQKFLVHSEGELLLVDRFAVADLLDDSDYDDYDDDDIPEPRWLRSVRFDVYRLDEEGKKWMHLRSLGDRVLFAGLSWAFSVSVSDLCVGKGNCVIFRDARSFDINDPESGMVVFHLDEGQISPLSDHPGFSKLFLPPPDWIRLQR